MIRYGTCFEVFFLEQINEVLFQLTRVVHRLLDQTFARTFCEGHA